VITALPKTNEAVARPGADLSEIYTRRGYIVHYTEEAVWVHGRTWACRCLRSCGGELRELKAAALHSRDQFQQFRLRFRGSFHFVLLF
jgi:hypothetical protein